MAHLLLRVAALLSLALVLAQAQGSCGNIAVSEDLYYVPGSDWMYAVSLNDSTGLVYSSRDLGKTWTDTSASLPGLSTPGIFGLSGAYKVYPTCDPQKVWVESWNWEHLWFSSDGGQTYSAFTAPDGGLIAFIEPHPFLCDYLLVLVFSGDCITGGPQCTSSLTYTSDFGQTWLGLDTFVTSAQWAIEGLPPGSRVDNYTVLYAAFPDKSGSVFSKSLATLQLDMMSITTKTRIVLMQNAPGFLAHDNVLFVATFPPQTLTTLRLKVSLDSGVTFHTCSFPHDVQLSETGYIILDTAEGAAFIAVDHTLPSNPAEWGHVYVSDAFDERFALSIPHVRVETNADGRFIDFMRVAIINGIYFANRYDVPMRTNPRLVTPVVSRVTFNKGGDWEPIPPPVGSQCGTLDCDLHVHGPVSRQRGQFYSDQYAAGLLVALGNVGQSLGNTTMNTFLSRDAGLTWTQTDLPSGDHIFEYADHGSVLVSAVSYTPDLRYSLQQGLEGSWITCGQEWAVSYITTNPKLSEPIFVLIANDRGSQKLVQLDFTNAFNGPCKGFDTPGINSDYEEWVPKSDYGGHCILGQSTTYVRRKQGALCANNLDDHPLSQVMICPCSWEDFECDECFVEDPDECDEPEPAVPPDPCVGVWYAANGYRLIAGDVCDQSDPTSYNPLARTASMPIGLLCTNSSTIGTSIPCFTPDTTPPSASTIPPTLPPATPLSTTQSPPRQTTQSPETSLLPVVTSAPPLTSPEPASQSTTGTTNEPSTPLGVSAAALIGLVFLIGVGILVVTLCRCNPKFAGMFRPGYSAPSSSRRERGEEDLGLVEAVSGDLEGAESGSFVGEAENNAPRDTPKKEAAPAPAVPVEPKAEAKGPEASNV